MFLFMKKILSIFFTLLLMGVSSSCNDEDVLIDPQQPEPKIGVFSVSPTKKVMFSPGLLQFNHSEKKWRIATNQWEVLAEKNADRFKSDFTGWIDLFSWSTTKSVYGVFFGFDYPDLFEGEFVDWGELVTNYTGWHTLSSEEWIYLLYQRPERGERTPMRAIVAGRMGYVIFPDDYVNPGVDYKVDTSFFNENEFSTAEWAKLEFEGAVFLPFAGLMRENDILGGGYYWTSSKDEGDMVIALEMDAGVVKEEFLSRKYGCAVRLVKTVE